MYLHFYNRVLSLDEGIVVGISDMVADQSENYFSYWSGKETSLCPSNQTP